MQKDALLQPFSPGIKEKKVRVVQKTGLGKSLVIMATALLFCCVYLVVQPCWSLALTAEQVKSVPGSLTSKGPLLSSI